MTTNTQNLRRVFLAALFVVVASEVPKMASAPDDESFPKVVRAVLAFDNLVAPALEVGANFTTVGRVVSVDGHPFDGRLAFACQITDLEAGAGACLYYFYLPGGEVTGTGDVRDGIPFPITGGTGRYVGVAGTVKITAEQEDGPRFAVFRLAKPTPGR
jgi:hypothetical protein